MMESHPAIDRPPTRHLERLEVDRFVPLSNVVRIGPAWVELAVQGTTDTSHTRLQPGVTLAGEQSDRRTLTVRIDAVNPTTFRYRVNEGGEAPDGRSPMLVNPVASCSNAEVVRAGDRWELRTGQATLVVVAPPFGPPSVELLDADRHLLTTIGGGEANFYSQWDSFPTGISRTPLAGHRLATEVFSLGVDEAIYGFGETFGRLDKSGQTIDINVEEALGTISPRSYKSVPFWTSSHGWGAFLHHAARSTVWVGSRCTTHLQVAVDDPWIDLFVFAGSISSILGSYTELTGKADLPPAWSFGFWQSKISYSSAEETLEVARRMRSEALPFDVLHLDTHWFERDWFCDLAFSPERFPDPVAYLAELAEMGVKVSLWQLPYIPAGSALFEELAAVDGFVGRAGGGIYDVGICYTPDWDGGVVGCIDFTNPAAVEIYQRRLAELLAMGARAIKVDFGEQAPVDGVYHDGTPGSQAHNLYPLLYNKAVAEVTHRSTGDWLIWARSAYAGSQRYPLHWGGDASVRWDNLLANLSGGLSLGLSGFSFWSMDIGGFLGEPDDQLLIRWLQAGLFLSHSRIHGFGNRQLYDRGATTQAARELLNLRYRLLPYLLAQAQAASAAGLPLARALVVDYQDDPTTWPIGDQWLLGPDLLVAPLSDPSGHRRVYLPAGGWEHWYTGARHRGARWIEVESPIEEFPLFQRLGSVIPLGPVMAHVGERPTDRLELRLRLGDEVQPFRTAAVVDGSTIGLELSADGVLAVSGLDHRVEVDVDQSGRGAQVAVRRTA